MTGQTTNLSKGPGAVHYQLGEIAAAGGDIRSRLFG
jgi:hypothetical protein